MSNNDQHYKYVSCPTQVDMGYACRGDSLVYLDQPNNSAAFPKGSLIESDVYSAWSTDRGMILASEATLPDTHAFVLVNPGTDLTPYGFGSAYTVFNHREWRWASEVTQNQTQAPSTNTLDISNLESAMTYQSSILILACIFFALFSGWSIASRSR